MQMPLPTRETPAESYARLTAGYRSVGEQNAAQRSIGHVTVIGDYEYFTAANTTHAEALYKAPTWNAIRADGYRNGARFVCGPHMIAHTIGADRAIHDALAEHDRTGRYVIVWRTPDPQDASRHTFAIGALPPHPSSVRYTSIGIRPEDQPADR